MLMNYDEKTTATSFLSRRFTLIEEGRKVGLCRQISLLYKRNMTNACRNPLQLLAVVVLGLIQSFLLIMLFGGVGDARLITFEDLQIQESVIFNWLGMVFLASSDQFIICAFAMVLMIPMAFPIYRREMGSHMYSATAYFISATAANICVNIFYPLLVSLLTFFFYGYPISTFEGFMCFFLI